MKSQKDKIAPTKEKLLDAGLEMMHSYGYRSTGIQGVLSSVEVPKGSFYNYFKSKEEFGLAVIDRYIELQGPIGMKHMADLRLPPLKRLRGFFEGYISIYQSKPNCGCLLGNFAQELSDEDPVFRKKLSRIFEAWIDSVEQCLVEAQKKGHLSKNQDAKKLAAFCVAGWEGALMQMKLQKSVSPLENFVDVMFGSILKK
ncbi:MAG: TetR family transcriptional regulator C-terminal domain-containing protein [Pseudobdellovibrionaceae bacterium]